MLEVCDNALWLVLNICLAESISKLFFTQRLVSWMYSRPEVKFLLLEIYFLITILVLTGIRTYEPFCLVSVMDCWSGMRTARPVATTTLDIGLSPTKVYY